jgi:hypothetical protein
MVANCTAARALLMALEGCEFGPARQGARCNEEYLSCSANSRFRAKTRSAHPMDTGSNDGMALRATLESCEVGDFDLQLLSECSHAVGFKSDYRVGKPRLNAGQRNSTSREALLIAPRPLACLGQIRSPPAP